MRVSVSLFRPRVTRKKDGKKIKYVVKIWHAAWRDSDTGKRRTKSTGTANRQSAQQFAVLLQDRIYRESIGVYDPAEENRNAAFTAAKDQFIDSQERRLRPQSVETYRYSLLSFERLMKPQELRKVDRRVLDEFVSKRVRDVGSITVNKDLRHMRAFELVSPAASDCGGTRFQRSLSYRSRSGSRLGTRRGC